MGILLRSAISAMLFIAVFFVSTTAASDRRVSLREAVLTAFEGNHELRAFKSGLSAVESDVAIAKSYLLPRVAFEERFMRTNNPTYSFMAKLNQSRFSEADFLVPSLNNPNAVNDFQTSLSFEQPIFVKKAYVGIEMSKKELGAKQEELRRKKEETAQKTAQAFLSVRTARDFVAVSAKSVEEAQAHLRTAELSYKNNLGLYSDILRAQTSLKEAEQNSLKAQKNLNIARRSLGLILGKAESIDADDTDIRITARGVEHYSALALSRGDIRAMELRHENAKNNIALAESDYYPIVGFGGSYQMNDHRKPLGSEGDSWQVMAFLRWNIFDGTKREHERSKARHQALQAGEYLSGMRKAAEYKVYEAFQGYEEALKAVELAQKGLEAAEEGMRLVKMRYENSLAPIIDLLNAQASLDNARANLTSKNNELKLTLINLSYESGTILKELGLE